MPYASHSMHFPDHAFPAVVDGWFDAMAALYRTLPGETETESRYPLFVTLGSQGINDAVLHPLGQEGGRRGFVLLNGPDDYEAWLALESEHAAAEDSREFPRLELTFGPLVEAHPDVQLELEQHPRDLGNAVPSVWSFYNTGKSHPGNVDDLRIFEAVAAAVASVLEELPENSRQLLDQQTIEPVTRTVDAGGADTEVELSTRPLADEAALPPNALLDVLRAQDDNNDGWLPESRKRHAIEYRLGRRFAHSPEAVALSGDNWQWRTCAQWAASHLGVTIASLDVSGLDEVVFDIVPRKVSANADYARPFIECLSAFYRWLDREYRLPQAPACLARLEAPDAVERLEAMMSDKRNFGRAKAMVMEARANGIDPSTPEGVLQMQAMVNARIENSRALQAGFDPFDEFAHKAVKLDPAVKIKRDAKRKTGRKAARKARKKNR